MKLSILLASASLALVTQAPASVLLDWATVTPSDRKLDLVSPPGPNGTYDTSSDGFFKGVNVTVAGSGFAKVGGLRDPVVEPAGHPYPAPVLSSVANFRPADKGGVTFTIDFFGFKNGVKDVSFDLFNVDNDMSKTKRLDDVITFRTAGLSLVGGKDVAISGNTATGIGDSGPPSWGGPQGEVAVHSGNLPLHRIVFNWTEKGFPGGTDFLEEIAVGNVIFTPVPEYGQLGIGLAAALLGGLWLAASRRKKAA